MRRSICTSVFITLGLCHCKMDTLQASPQHSKVQVKPHRDRFGYIFKETTGITTHVLVGGKETAIMFSSHSDRHTRETLFALTEGILLANAVDGKRMFLEGDLSPEVKHTPDGPNMPMSEAYHEFTLRRWFILTPFQECVEDKQWNSKIVTRRHLRAASFEPKVPGDLRRFELRSRP